MSYEYKDVLEDKAERALERARGVLAAVERERGEHAKLTHRERQRFDRHFDTYKQAKRKIEKGHYNERAVVGADAFSGSGGDVETRGRNMSASEERQRIAGWIRAGVGGETRAASQSVGTAAEGGVLSSTGLFPEVERVLQQFGGVRNLNVNRVQTPDGRSMNHPGVDDVGEQASIVSEGSTIGSVGRIDMFDVQTNPHTYQAGPLAVSNELLMDSEVDVVEVVTDSLFERIGRATEQDYAGSTNTSSTSPNGLVTLSTGAVSMEAGSSNLTDQILRDLFFSVDASYRRSGEWAVSDNALQAISDLSDGDGRPLVQPSLQADLDVELFGKPLRVVQDLGDIATSTEFPILFGDFNRGFLLRDVAEIRLQRLDELYAETRQTGFVAWFRTDSKARFSSTVAAANRPVRALRTT